MAQSAKKPATDDDVACAIRAALVPHVAAAFPWADMPVEQREGYLAAARAARELIGAQS